MTDDGLSHPTVFRVDSQREAERLLDGVVVAKGIRYRIIEAREADDGSWEVLGKRLSTVRPSAWHPSMGPQRLSAP